MRVLPRVALLLFAIFFVAAGISHFALSGVYVRIVPPWLPMHVLLVQISGICEILGGIGLLFRKTRRFSGIGLNALLVAVFPANVQMALHPELYANIASAQVLWVRLPLQFVLIALVWWISAPHERRF